MTHRSIPTLYTRLLHRLIIDLCYLILSTIILCSLYLVFIIPEKKDTAGHRSRRFRQRRRFRSEFLLLSVSITVCTFFTRLFYHFLFLVFLLFFFFLTVIVPFRIECQTVCRSSTPLVTFSFYRKIPFSFFFFLFFSFF